MKRGVVSAACLVAGLLLIGTESAQADSITITSPIASPVFVGSGVRHTVEEDSIDIALDDKAFLNASFAGFDESLYGTLLSVDLSATYLTSGLTSAQIISSTTYPASISGDVGFTEVVKVGGVGGTYASDARNVGNVVFGCTASLPSGACLTHSTALVGATFGATFDGTTPGYLALFTNEIVLSIQLASLLTPTVDADVTSHAMALTLKDLDSVAYSLTYTYTPHDEPVPEPSTFILVGLGTLGLAARKRLRRVRA